MYLDVLGLYVLHFVEGFATLGLRLYVGCWLLQTLWSFDFSFGDFSPVTWKLRHGSNRN